MKNLAKYNSIEGIGTIHWFRTLTCNAKHMAEYIGNPNNTNNNPWICHGYGIEIKNILEDLLEWQETHQPLKEDI